jgi:hypothetical protein
MAAAQRHDCPECNAVMDSVRYLEGPLRELQKDATTGRYTRCCDTGNHQDPVSKWKMYFFRYRAEEGRVPPRYTDVAFRATVGARNAHDGRHALLGWLAEWTAYPQAVLVDVLRRAEAIDEPPQEVCAFGSIEEYDAE